MTPSRLISYMNWYMSINNIIPLFISIDNILSLVRFNVIIVLFLEMYFRVYLENFALCFNLDNFWRCISECSRVYFSGNQVTLCRYEIAHISNMTILNFCWTKVLIFAFLAQFSNLNYADLWMYESQNAWGYFGVTSNEDYSRQIYYRYATVH